MNLTAKVGKRMGKGVNRLFKINGAELVCVLLLALYAGLAAPALPNVLIEMADSLVGRLVFLFLIGYVASKNIKVALMVAVAFSVTLHIANKRVTESYINALRYERFTAQEEEEEPEFLKYEGFHGGEDPSLNYEAAAEAAHRREAEAAAAEESSAEADGTYTHTHEHTHTKDIPEPSAESLAAVSGTAEGSVAPAGAETAPFSNYEGFWGGAQGSSE